MATLAIHRVNLADYNLLFSLSLVESDTSPELVKCTHDEHVLAIQQAQSFRILGLRDVDGLSSDSFFSTFMHCLDHIVAADHDRATLRSRLFAPTTVMATSRSFGLLIEPPPRLPDGLAGAVGVYLTSLGL